ncbi:uncharacterized protein LOC134812905 [Bolinopsis microptera]|uniref:uncharacterized protein LOC134812905 n=1 Tax=Bolinopsis microptera TaxID=2820187 RepID=UPI00307A0AA5
MFLLLIVVIILPTVASDDEQYTALHFGTSANDNIGFKFNMAPFQDSFSICTWAKRIYTSSSYPVLFDYESSTPDNEIVLDATGIHKHIAGGAVSGNMRSAVTKPVGSWFSYCITWSLASRSIKLYIDGSLVGTGTTVSGRTLKMGGTLFFNRLSYSTSSGYIFGGQLYQFNVYSQALSSTEVKKIAEGGLCFDLTEFAETRVLKWEHIMSQSRSGSVSEVLIGSMSEFKMCQWKKELDSRLKVSKEKLVNISGQLNTTLEELGTVKGHLSSTKEDLNTTQEELGTVKDHLNSTQEELETVKDYLNSTQEELGTVRGHLNSTQEDLNSTQEELGTVKGELERTERELQTETAQHNKTGEKLDTCSTSLTSTLTQLDDARTFHNITRWDVLYTSTYFNKVLTEESFKLLSTSWGMLGKFVGLNITEGVVEHFRQYHQEPVCDVFEQITFPMLTQFEGVDWTRGINEHFRDTHLVNRDDSPCESDTES